jgi:flavocytochrome c
MTRFNRRSFLKGISAAAGVLTIGKFSIANASLLPSSDRTEAHNVVVIGTGLAGLSAALQARQAGADVILLEKVANGKDGGTSKLAGGGIVIPPERSPAGIEIFCEDFAKKSLGRGNAELSRVLAEQVLDGVDWLEAQGVEFVSTTNNPPYRVKIMQVAPAAYVGMPAALGKLKAKFLEAGGKFAYSTKAKQLIMDSRGKVIGVRAMGTRGSVDYMADAVIIASGGYAGNKEMLQTFVDPDADKMMVRGIPWATGDGLLMAREAGAMLVSMGGMTALHMAAVSTESPASGNPVRGLPYCLGINKNGQRYVDESRGYVAHGKAAMKQPGQKVALIFDEEIRKMQPLITSWDVFARQGIKIVEAGSLQELAQKIDVPPDALVKTVMEFNNAVKDNQALSVIPPKTALAYKIQTPKFYAFHPLVPGITLSFGGIKINPKGQVQESDGTIIPGLFAAGECAGALFYDDYIGGSSLCNCLVMGRVTGRGAAAMKTELKAAKNS